MLHENEVRFAVSPAPGGKRLVGIFDGIFRNDDEIAEYLREQAQLLFDYANGIDDYTRERREEREAIGAGNGVS